MKTRPPSEQHPDDVDATHDLAEAIGLAIADYIGKCVAATDGNVDDKRMTAVIGAALVMVTIRAGQLGDPLLPHIVVIGLGGTPLKPH